MDNKLEESFKKYHSEDILNSFQVLNIKFGGDKKPNEIAENMYFDLYNMNMKLNVDGYYFLKN